jgi:hypothetical protein
MVYGYVKGWKTTLNKAISPTVLYQYFNYNSKTAKIAINEAGIAFVSLGPR